jgi:hypothetical protein
MKEIADAAPGYPGETIAAPGRVRLRYQRFQPVRERTLFHKLAPLLLLALAAAVLMPATLGRGKSSQGAAPPAVHTTLSGNVAGHEITADLDATGVIADRSKEPGVEFLGHKLVIEKDRLLLDGMERTKIAAGAKLAIVVANTKLSVTADGRKTFRTTIKR